MSVHFTKRGACNPIPLQYDQTQSLRGCPLPSGREDSRFKTAIRNRVGNWRWEIFTFSLGTGAFVSILALLRFHDHEPQQWAVGNERFHLTAIVAALAQVAQSALLVPISVVCENQGKREFSLVNFFSLLN
ncbi:hypothetical protein BCR34DRAFT_98033 [Clohesyomyces aquaticus]|uniref:Uncharacterized protein n=1 Tax=Clohesyomyces aquaticus TaxID=1231657 RepID=A0A1Y1YUN5_9PLEO|nr:hypothetical protein BCR34DRAFT_98033 [Clohesyomyces aquaticus]